MLFKNRKLYPHGQNNGIYLIQIPKVICEDLELNRADLLSINYDNKRMIIELQEHVEPAE